MDSQTSQSVGHNPTRMTKQVERDGLTFHSRPNESERVLESHKTNAGTTAPVDQQPGAQSAGWPARDGSERNVVIMSQHDGCEGSSTGILVATVRDGCDGVCACAEGCSSVASFASKCIVRVWE